MQQLIRRLACLVVLQAALPVSLAGPAAAADVSFRNDVMPALSKAGCNLGTCHGNARGKGGFQLSLRGQDPAGDYRTLTHEWLARRANMAEPERSLLLLKPTMQLAHEGGQRFAIGSHEYNTLRDWIGAGMPADAATTPRVVGLDVSTTRVILEAPHWKQQLTVRARFSDGTIRDVSPFAVYDVGTPIVDVSPDGLITGRSEGETVVLVRYVDQQAPVTVALIPARPDYVWQGPKPAGVIDELVFAKLRELKLQPSEICDDSTFLRRASLDLTGTLPTAEQARQFLNDPAPDKRAQLVEQLMQRPEFAEWWALKWSDMLRVEEKTLDVKGTAGFHAWLRSAFATGMPLDELVRSLVTGQGSTYSQPAANFYRALRDPFARSESVGQLFLGVRLQCAKCHNHPFDRWTQDDYYAWGNVFARIDYKIVDNERRDQNDKHEFDGEQVVYQQPTGDVADPRTGKPRAPKLLGETAPQLQPGDDRLEKLADWLTSAENDRFAQMLVNRVWAQLMGRGIVEPVDDFRATNPPTHPELLQALSTSLRSHGFDLRSLLREIVNSRTYQLSSTPNATNAGDEMNYSRGVVRRLTAEQLADGLSQVTEVAIPFQKYPPGTEARQLAGVGAMLRRQGGPLAGDEWLRIYGRPQRLQACECERSDETTLTQAFQLISSDLMHRMTTDARNRVSSLLDQQLETSAAISELYWASLSREPTEAELTALSQYVAGQQDRKTALQDVLWSLVTSHEFLLRR